MDYALPFRRELIANASEQELSADEQIELLRLRTSRRRACAIATLGDSWVMHPRYNPLLHPHHSASHKDSAVLKRVADAARSEGRL